MAVVKLMKKHIKNGEKYHPYKCPIALAVKEQCKLNVIAIHLSQCMIFDNKSGMVNRIISLPRSVCRFINNFDKGMPVKPFNFRLVYNEG